MFGEASFTKPALPIPSAFGADLSGGLGRTLVTDYLGRLVSGQQLHGAFRRALFTKGNDLELKLGRGSEVILIEKLRPHVKHLAQRLSCAHFSIHAVGGIANAVNFKGAQVAATF
jgi:hypothetical protein